MAAPWDHRSPSEHARIERLHLGRWLPAAVTFSPYWAERARSLGLDPDRLGSRDDLRHFAPSRERDVVGAGGPGAPALLMRPTEAQVKARASGGTLWRIARSVRHGGSDAKRLSLLQEYKPVHLVREGPDEDLVIAYTRSDLDRLHRAGARAASVLGLRDADYLVSAVPKTTSLAFWGVYHLALGASMLAVHGRDAEEAVDEAVAAFSLVPATAVVVPVEEATALAAAVTENDADAGRVRMVVTIGPPPTEERRAAIADAWRAAGATQDVRVRALFAAPGGRALWAEEADDPSGLVTYPDLEVLEVVDPITGQITDGPGDLVVTTMGWHGTALLRFQTGVFVGGLDDGASPSSGRTTPRIVGDVAPGVWQPRITTPEGPVRIDLRGAAAALSTTPAVGAWRVELRGPVGRGKHDRVVVEFSGDLDEPALRDLDARVGAAMGAPPSQLVSEHRDVVQQRAGELGSVFADLR